MIDQEWYTTAADVKMPCLIYGTAWKKERTTDLVVKAITAGFRGIDTACQPKHYAEPLVGDAVHRLNEQGIKRESLFLQTKFTPLNGQDPTQIPYDKFAPLAVQVAQSFAVSQKNLRTQYVDSLVLHSPLESHGLLMEAWRAMEVIYQAGGARQLGISNCYSLATLTQLYSDAMVKPAVVQNRFYDKTGYDVDLRDWCKKQGVIYQSFWTLTANPDITASEVIKSLARKNGKTVAQVFFRYLTQVGIAPLTGTCSAQHMQEDLEIFSFKLSSDEITQISRLLD